MPAERRTAANAITKRCAFMQHLQRRLVRSGPRLRLGRLLLVLVFVVAAAEYTLPEAWLFLVRVFLLLLLLLWLLLGPRLVRRGTLWLVRHQRGWGRFLTYPEYLLDEAAIIG